MRNKEFTNTVLQLLREHKSNKKIAEITNRHRNTISKYVNYIRTNLVRNPEEIVNKIDDKLNDELEAMTHRDLIAYRRVLTPQKAEIKTETTAEIKHEIRLKLDEMSEDEREFCKRIARNYIKTNNQTRPNSIH